MEPHKDYPNLILFSQVVSGVLKSFLLK